MSYPTTEADERANHYRYEVSDFQPGDSVAQVTHSHGSVSLRWMKVTRVTAASVFTQTPGYSVEHRFNRGKYEREFNEAGTRDDWTRPGPILHAQDVRIGKAQRQRAEHARQEKRSKVLQEVAKSIEPRYGYYGYVGIADEKIEAAIAALQEVLAESQAAVNDEPAAE